MKGSVAFVASTPRVEFSTKLEQAVVTTATALLSSERLSLMHAKDFSVGEAWTRRGNGPFSGQVRRAPTLALMMALHMAHNEAPDLVLWPTPRETLEERHRNKKRRGDSRERGDRNVLAPGVATAKLGETAIMVTVATTTTVVVAVAVVEAGEARRVLVVAQDAAKGETRADPTGMVAAALGKVPEGGGTEHKVVQQRTARPPLPARRHARARTTAK